jgi:hypothetical protein
MIIKAEIVSIKLHYFVKDAEIELIANDVTIDRELGQRLMVVFRQYPILRTWKFPTNCWYLSLILPFHKVLTILILLHILGPRRNCSWS